jgi:hypothetical protein
MKYCPNCNRSYEDEQMRFCLDDGAQLVSFSQANTLIIPAQAPSNKEEAGVRTMISIEITENLADLQRFKDEVASKVQFKSLPMASVDRSNALNHIPPPKIKLNYWDSLTPSIATALAPDEIRNVHHFYNQLDELNQLMEANRNPRSQWRKSVDALVDEILERGNPLKS